jgi:hypothetical protein
MFIQNTPQSTNFRAHLILPTSVSDKFNKTASEAEKQIYQEAKRELKQQGGDDIFHALRFNDQGFILRTYREGTNNKLKSEPLKVEELTQTAKEFSEAV